MLATTTLVSFLACEDDPLSKTLIVLLDIGRRSTFEQQAGLSDQTVHASEEGRVICIQVRSRLLRR